MQRLPIAPTALLALGVWAVSPACGTPEDGPPADPAGTGGSGNVADGGEFPAAALSSFETEDGAVSIELRTAPAQPPVVGNGQRGELRVVDAATGAPQDGLAITVTSWMPAMRHQCSPVNIAVSPQGGGVYLLSPLVMTMPGECELELEISGERSGSAVSPPFLIVSP